jgi:L-ascorbate metabolism protein UlaG (beta-lactamase superfamily)
MDITWFGRSCFRLRAGPLSILTDPFGLPGVPATSDGTPPLGADIVTLSDRSARHLLLVRQPYRLVEGPGEYEIQGVPITGVATTGAAPEGEAPARPRAGQNFVYSLVLDGVSVCHLGRLAQPPTAQQVQEIGLPDVALIPLGEPRGLSVQRAVQLASQLESKLLVPMTLGGDEDRAALEAFCRELGTAATVVEPRITVTPGGLPPQARVVVLAEQMPMRTE